jgi:hypothetical protein
VIQSALNFVLHFFNFSDTRLWGNCKTRIHSSPKISFSPLFSYYHNKIFKKQFTLRQTNIHPYTSTNLYDSPIGRYLLRSTSLFFKIPLYAGEVTRSIPCQSFN